MYKECFSNEYFESTERLSRDYPGVKGQDGVQAEKSQLHKARVIKFRFSEELKKILYG